MALPVVHTLSDCVNFTQTVSPYIHQLYDLPQRILQSYSNSTELYNLYLSTNPIVSAFAFSLLLALIFLLVSEVNRNYSQVDRCWSILPTIYNAHFTIYAHMSGLPTQRLDNLLAFSVLWSLRLTFNYWRKGGYNIGSEDYRWEVVRKYISAPLFFAFNVVFISLIQSLLLFAIATPTYVLLLASKLEENISTVDTVFPRVLMGLVLLEFFADQQQWDYQSAKKKYLETAKVPYKFDQEDLDRGFVVTGLWSWSRHPNFAAEQAIWVTLYQWSCVVTSSLYNWTGVGAIAYLCLFQASTWFTEWITSRKYPEYKEYQQRVGMFLPKLYSDLPGDFSEKKAKPKVENKKEEKIQRSLSSFPPCPLQAPLIPPPLPQQRRRPQRATAPKTPVLDEEKLLGPDRPGIISKIRSAKTKVLSAIKKPKWATAASTLTTMSTLRGEANNARETNSLTASSTSVSASVSASASATSSTLAGAANGVPKAPRHHRHAADPLLRDCDPGRDNQPIDKLLARPRLPRSPFEYDQKRVFAVNISKNIERPIKSQEERAAEFQREKDRFKALGEEVSGLEIKEKGDGESEFCAWTSDLHRAWSDFWKIRGGHMPFVRLP